MRDLELLSTNVLALIAALLFPPSAVQAVPFSFQFSIDGASLTVSTVGNNDVLSPGPVGGPPGIHLSAAALGLPAVSADEVDAFTFAYPDEGLGQDPSFSVDRLSVGAPGSAVAVEAAAGQAAGDVFKAEGQKIALNQDRMGLLPAISAGVSVLPPIDNIDGLGLSSFEPIQFSLAAGNSFGFSGADILSPGPALMVPAGDLGLLVSDDIDALHRAPFGTPCAGAGGIDCYLFSLARDSPTLILGGFSPADIFVSTADGTFSVYWTAESLGLLPTDNIDALAFPEPGASGLLGLGLAIVGWRAFVRGRCHEAVDD